MHRSKKLFAWRVMQFLALLPLFVPLAISGCLPLYHALRDGDFEAAASLIIVTPQVTEGALAKTHERFSPGHIPTVKSSHFCGVCAFLKSMHGAAAATRRQLLPPSPASSALLLMTGVTPSGITLRAVSRAPPVPFLA